MCFIELYTFSVDENRDAETFIEDVEQIIVARQNIKCITPTCVIYKDDNRDEYDGHACLIEFVDLPLLALQRTIDREVYVAENYESLRNRIANNIFFAPEPKLKELKWEN